MPIAGLKPNASDERYVLDSSVVLASLFQEAGAVELDPVLPLSQIGAVNLAEVVTKLQERGFPDGAIDEMLADIELRIVPFDVDQAIHAGKLRAATRAAGLSLGDRACLALAAAEGATAITMDRHWATLDLPVPVRVARG